MHGNEQLISENDQSVKTLGLNWHPVSDCFQHRCVNKVDSVKPVGITANFIKPTKNSIVDFEVVAEKVKNQSQKTVFSSFEVDLTQKLANVGRSFPTEKIKNREQTGYQHTSLACPLTGIIQMPPTKFFCKSQADFTGAIMRSTSTEYFKVKIPEPTPQKRQGSAKLALKRQENHIETHLQ